MTPHSKHYASKYYWFCSKIGPDSEYSVDLLKMDSANQLGDIFTKSLGHLAFKILQKSDHF